jgi:hypothetical protein
MAAVASISRARGWAVRTAAPLRAAESRADVAAGCCDCTTAQPVRVKVAADGVVEHVVSRSHGDKRETDGEDASRCGGPRCAESMLRERGASNQWRCGRPYAAAGTRPRWAALIGSKPTRVGLAVVIAHTVRWSPEALRVGAGRRLPGNDPGWAGPFLRVRVLRNCCCGKSR